jgi:hypothetical protein
MEVASPLAFSPPNGKHARSSCSPQRGMEVEPLSTKRRRYGDMSVEKLSENFSSPFFSASIQSNKALFAQTNNNGKFFFG